MDERMTTRSLSHAIVLLFVQSFLLCGFLATFDYALEADASNRQNSYSPHLNGKPTSLPVTYTRKFLVDSIFFNGDLLLFHPSSSSTSIFSLFLLFPSFFKSLLRYIFSFLHSFLGKIFYLIILSYHRFVISKHYASIYLLSSFFIFFSSIGWDHIYSLCIFCIKFSAKTFTFEISK